MDNKQKLLALIEELKIPFTEEQLNENISHLNDEEIELLIIVAQELKNYYDATREAAYLANPDEAKKIDEEYKNKLLDLEAEYQNEIDKTDEIYDRDLDDLDKEAQEENRSITDIVKDIFQKFAQENSNLLSSEV